MRLHVQKWCARLPLIFIICLSSRMKEKDKNKVKQPTYFVNIGIENIGMKKIFRKNRPHIQKRASFRDRKYV